jgi:hypothetical protein
MFVARVSGSRLHTFVSELTTIIDNHIDIYNVSCSQTEVSTVRTMRLDLAVGGYGFDRIGSARSSKIALYSWRRPDTGVFSRKRVSGVAEYRSKIWKLLAGDWLDCN